VESAQNHVSGNAAEGSATSDDHYVLQIVSEAYFELSDLLEQRTVALEKGDP
jgi:hypothetical protein